MGGPNGAERLGDGMAGALAELWAEQRGTALERAGVLEDAAVALAAGALADEQREAARSAAHKLRGSAGTYGFHRASELAAELEDMLAAGPIEVERTPHVASIVLALRTELEGEPSGGAAHFAGAASRTGATVLAVDDDPAVLAALRAVLEPRGYEYVPLSDPTEFWARLEEADPDLAVIDLDMPRVDGLDICRAVRSDPAWAHLPLLILTAYRDPEFMRNAFAAGADDFVAKPIEEEELVARIANRLERVRAARESTGRDTLTGLPTRQRALGQISQVLGADPATPMPVALIAVRGLELLNERAGQRAGDDRLRDVAAELERQFPHAVGRYGGATFVALLPTSATADPAGPLGEVLDRVLSDHAGQELAAAVGFATRDTLDTTLRAAERVLKPHEGTRVRIVGDRASACLDVVYVEDEDSVAEVLKLALDTLGLTSRRLADGTAAVATLAGSDPELGARVVLLDWDLPGLDGLSVLRQLAADGVLDSTRVIMLTARASEDETVRALELGAFDFVAKPFSVPVLVERLRVALER